MSSDRQGFGGRRLPPLNAVRSFEVAARHGSFLKAAAELHVTAGAVSRSVKSLEDYLGVELFVRSHRTLKLSPDGRTYANVIAQSLAQLSDTTEELFPRGARNVLRVCCHLTFAVHWLIPRWARFQSHHPEYEIEVHTDVSPQSADSDTFDFVVALGAGVGVNEKLGLTSTRIVDLEMFPVCAPSLLARHGRVTRPDDLFEHHLIKSARRPDDWQNWLESAGFNTPGMPRVATYENLTHAYSAAVSGGGIAMGIRAFVAGELESGRLRRLFDHVYRDPRGLNLTYKTDKANALPKVRHFADWMISESRRDSSNVSRPHLLGD